MVEYMHADPQPFWLKAIVVYTRCVQQLLGSPPRVNCWSRKGFLLTQSRVHLRCSLTLCAWCPDWSAFYVGAWQFATTIFLLPVCGTWVAARCKRIVGSRADPLGRGPSAAPVGSSTLSLKRASLCGTRYYHRVVGQLLSLLDRRVFDGRWASCG